MYRGVVVALDPSPAQKKQLVGHAGAYRFAYNCVLRHVLEARNNGDSISWSFYSLRKWWNLQKDTVAPWWRKYSKEAFSSGIESLSRALRTFADSRVGDKGCGKIGFPKFKSKKGGRLHFAYTTGIFGIIENDSYGLRLPRIGRVHCMENVRKRVGNRHVTRMTIFLEAGRWYASLTVQDPETPNAPARSRGKTVRSVGVDLGLKSLATLSDGVVFPNPRALEKHARSLRKAQRKLARKRPGSKRRERQRNVVAHIHRHAANCRNDAIHKTTTFLAKTYDEISVEDLNVKGMMRNHRLAGGLQDASFGEFRRQLTYKCLENGAALHVVNRFYPSSKTCSSCGTVRTKLFLKERVFHCPNCGLTIDRDLNAAINIDVAGSAPETKNARGVLTRP
ncbi:IS607 family element RNA-guided endonuclease TnpB [Bifidobacterium choloepi]|nr:IS607 family element RNA-guided endonuclease TnpB [Bifidobacterium choloepi]